MERGESWVWFGFCCVRVCGCCGCYIQSHLTHLLETFHVVVMSWTALSWVLRHVFCILYWSGIWHMLRLSCPVGEQVGVVCTRSIIPPHGLSLILEAGVAWNSVVYVDQLCRLLLSTSPETAASMPAFPSRPRGSRVGSLSGLFPSSTVGLLVSPLVGCVSTHSSRAKQ